MIRVQGTVARRSAAGLPPTGVVIAGKLPLPVKRVLSTKMSWGRILPPMPPSGFVEVSTFPCVLIRISIVKRLGLEPVGARPEGDGGQASDALAAEAGSGAAERAAINSAASSATVAIRTIA